MRLLSDAAVRRAREERIRARDVVAGSVVRRSLGFMLADPGQGDPRPATAFGHPGMGGSVGFADPAARLAMGYVMNRMKFALDTRAVTLCRAVYASLPRSR